MLRRTGDMYAQTFNKKEHLQRHERTRELPKSLSLSSSSPLVPLRRSGGEFCSKETKLNRAPLSAIRTTLRQTLSLVPTFATLMDAVRRSHEGEHAALAFPTFPVAASLTGSSFFSTFCPARHDR